MTGKEIAESGNPTLIGAYAAMKRAAIRAREVARETNTYIVVKKNGKIVKLYPGDEGFEFVDPDLEAEPKPSEAGK